MAIAFTYTEATNLVVVTGGTSGTPATFADFVTADRAGTATLLVSVAGESAMTLTYPIRPVEDLALQISFVVTSKSEDGNIYVTGTDWKGDAQTENITANSDDTYVSVGYYATITQIDCTVAVDGAGDDWGVGGAGDIQVTQPQWGVIWDYGNGQYLVDSWFNVGNGGTSTYFRTTNEQIEFSAPFIFEVKDAAEFKSGLLAGSFGYDGSMIALSPGHPDSIISSGESTATVKLYGSRLHIKTTASVRFYDAVLDVRSSILSSASKSENNNYFVFSYWLTLTLIDVIISNVNKVQVDSTGTIDDFMLHYSTDGITYGSWANQVVLNVTLSEVDASRYDVRNNVNRPGTGYSYALKNPAVSIVKPVIANVETNSVMEQYTCNIHVVDKDGTAIQSVVVDCEDQNTDAVWAAGTISTDASGDITEQTITYKSWTGTSETLADFSPHKFTLSKAGYETLILDNITVDAPIVWHLELQDTVVASKGEVLYDDSGATYIGLCDKMITKI